MGARSGWRMKGKECFFRKGSERAITPLNAAVWHRLVRKERRVRWASKSWCQASSQPGCLAWTRVPAVQTTKKRTVCAAHEEGKQQSSEEPGTHHQARTHPWWEGGFSFNEIECYGRVSSRFKLCSPPPTHTQPRASCVVHKCSLCKVCLQPSFYGEIGSP